jgi:hypothetical protein
VQPGVGGFRSTGQWPWLPRVGVLAAGRGQAGECRAVVLVAAGLAGPGSRSRLSLLHRRSASTRFSMASMPQRIRGMK